jgi:arabinogalactan oligomer / maltooligosaccharide transport system permease protein
MSPGGQLEGPFRLGLIGLVLTQARIRFTLDLGLSQFEQGYGGQFPLMAAAVIMASAPASVVHVVLRRYFVSGLTAGGVS